MPPAPSSESSRLLPPTARQDAASSMPYDGEITTSRRFTVALPYLIIFLAFEVAVTLVDTPMSPIQEDIICRNHYPDAVNGDPRCKNEIVQSEFSNLKGWEMTFGLLPGMITAVPYGMAADRYGRRVVLGLSLLGLTLSQAVNIVVCHSPEIFPLRLIWLGATFTLVGGGPLVTTAMLFVIATDISTEAQRSTTFFYLSAISLIGQLIAAPLTYAAMGAGNFFAVFVGFGCLAASILAIFTTCETYGISYSDNRDETPSSANDTPSVGPRMYIFGASKQVAVAIRSLFWDSKQVGLLLSTFLFTSIGKNIPIILMQYVAKRFQWTWAEAGLLNSISAAARLVAVVLILPFASQVFTERLGLGSLSKDLWLARTGVIALLIGVFGIGLASSPIILTISLIIYSLGFGYGPAMRSLLVTRVQGRGTSALFMSISMLESIGLLISGPLLAKTFQVGMVWGDVWIGLPFISVGCCMACATAIVICIRFSEE